MNEETAGLEGGSGLGSASGSEGGASTRFPWPPAEGESFLDALSRTWQMSLFRPREFFAALPQDNPIQPAVGYALLMGIAGAAISTFWGFVLPGKAIDPATVDPTEMLKHPMDYLFHAPRPTVSDFLMAPLLLLLTLFIGAAVVHLLVSMIMREHGPYRRTLCALCYTHGTVVFGIVPILGTLIGMIWALVLTVVGLREAHRSTTGRAVAVMLVPVGCMLLAGLLVAILAISMKGVLTP